MKFTILGEIKTKGRPRCCLINGRPHIYTPRETQEYEEHIKYSYLNQSENWQKQPYFSKDIALSLRIRAIFKPSIANAKKWAKLGSYPNCTKHKDIDNICKVVMDALNGVMYEDDKQIVELVGTKTYGEIERIEVECCAMSAENGKETA